MDCWAYVDLTSNTVLLQRGDQFLNVIDVQRLLRYPGGLDGVISYSVAGDSIQGIPFDSMSANARYYFTRNAFFTFFYNDYFRQYANPGFWQRIDNLFTLVPMYAVYSDNLPSRNYHWVARVFTNYLFALTFLIWVGLLAAWLIRWLRKRK